MANLEKTQVAMVRWSPKRLTATDIAAIVQGYGCDNDSLEGEKYDANVVQWRIEIKVKRIGGAEIWP